MLYRTLGRTGLKVSQLGFGAMRLPMTGEGEAARVDTEQAVAMIQRAFAAGVNYIDTAIFYCNSDSQRAVGEALKGWRDRVIVSTKNHFIDDESEWWRQLENSLKLLQVDSIDIYNTHGINWKSWVETVEPRTRKWIDRAKDEGLIKHVCTSFHDSNEALMKIVDTGYFESITLQYNMLYRDLEEGIAFAHEKNVGVVVMGPVAGGRLGEPSQVLQTLLPEVKRVPELALRFVLANPHVSVALSGMSAPEHVEENIQVASDPLSLTPADQEAIDGHLKRLKEMATLYCTACGYCLPCPEGVDIPRVFEKYNNGRVYGLWKVAREAYGQMSKVEWDKGQRGDACIECGQCEDKCPQRLPIRERLKEAHEALTKE